MVRHIEIEPKLSAFSESWQIYSTLIKPDGKNAVVGPGESLFIDPTLLTVSMLMSKGSGELILIDPKNSRFPDANTDPDIRRRIAGAGNADTYLDQLRKLKQLGIPIKMPTYREGAHALNFCLPEKRCLDAICDHDLSPFLVNYSIFSSREVQDIREEYLTIYRYFLGNLKPGGLLILQTDNELRGLKGGSRNGLSMVSILEEAGFREIKYLIINDLFRFSIPRNLLNEFDNYIYTQRWRRGGYRYFFEHEGDNVIITIPVAGHSSGVQHPSPDVYIAVA